MNVISMCLFGAEPKYCVGAVKNAHLAKTFYPGWKMVVYLGKGVPQKTQDDLRKAGVVLYMSPLNPMIARFLICDNLSYERFIVRDTDSRFNKRESDAVQQWIESDRAFHIIRDHPGHGVCIGGGLWGAKTGAVQMSKLIDAWKGHKEPGSRLNIYNQDQMFLRDMVWPVARKDSLQHDLCYRHVFRDAVPFPASFDDPRFVGEVFDENDKPDPFHWQMRLNYMSR